jgi:DisA bacterial checkpoint controller nucleotide-binding
LTPAVEVRRRFIDDLYYELLARGIAYFLPDCSLTVIGPSPRTDPLRLEIVETNPKSLELHWLEARYVLSHPSRPFTEQQRRLIAGMGAVLAARYRFLFGANIDSPALDLYRGMPEDRYISAFLDQTFYKNSSTPMTSTDRIAEAIAVLRLTSSMTYENRRIATGALLFGVHPDPCHDVPETPAGAVAYGDALTTIRSFHRLSDGLQTVALVDRAGLLVELIEVQEWAKPFAGMPLPAPSAANYDAHSRATLCGGHIFVILTPNGELKIIAGGMQVFNFLDGRWRLTDLEEKYRRWETALGDRRFAEIIFTVALNLADARRGCLFVILDDDDSCDTLLSSGDLLAASSSPDHPTSKQQLHYLLRGKRALDMAAPVLESIARIDGAIVLSRNSDLLAFGAILHPPSTPAYALSPSEGGRTTAAMNASRLGKVLKVSEDGQIAFYENGSCIWEM